MPKKSAAGYSSDSSEDEYSVSFQRYQQLQITHGLNTRLNRRRAVQELTAVLDQLYIKYCAKPVQLKVFDDILVALRVLARCKKYQEAVIKLVNSAKKVLPHQKRNLVLKEHKTAQLAQRRSGRREGGASSSNGSMTPTDGDEDEEDDLVFGHLPTEVVNTIFSHLDPLSLAAAACVSRDWMHMSYDCRSWMAWVQACSWTRGPATAAAAMRTASVTAAAASTGSAVSSTQAGSALSSSTAASSTAASSAAASSTAAGSTAAGSTAPSSTAASNAASHSVVDASTAPSISQPATTSSRNGAPLALNHWHRHFSLIVTGWKSLLLPWQSDRVLLNGQPSWQGMSNGMDWLRMTPQARQQAFHKPSSTAMPLTVSQVLQWLLTQHVTARDPPRHGQEGAPDSSDDDEEGGLLGPMRLWNLQAGD